MRASGLPGNFLFDQLVVLFKQLYVLVFPGGDGQYGFFEGAGRSVGFFGVFQQVFGHIRKFAGKIVPDHLAVCHENMVGKIGVDDMLIVGRPGIPCFPGDFFFIPSGRFHRHGQYAPAV